LLSIALKANHIAIDPTYKLVWQGCPVIQVGSTDNQKHYQPFGLAVCDKEEDIDFYFIFSSLLKLVPGFHPTILLADGSHAIADIKLIQTATSLETFVAVSKLFLAKWSPKSAALTEFCK